MTELQKFDQLKADVAKFVAPVKTLLVSDPASNRLAEDTGRMVKQLLREVDSVRDSIVRPFNEQVKSVNAYAKEIANPLHAAEIHIKNQIAEYALKLAREREALRLREEAERKRLEAEEAAKRKEAADLEAAFGKTAAQSTTQEVKEVQQQQVAVAKETRVAQKELAKPSSVRMVWDFEVVDKTLVPNEYLGVLSPLVMQAIVSGGKREIPGLKIFQKPQVALGR